MTENESYGTYDLVWDTDQTQFILEVDRRKKRGWRLVGGVVITTEYWLGDDGKLLSENTFWQALERGAG